MSEILGNVALGFGVALSPYNLMFCLLGTVLGTAIGVLPGLGPVATMALLLPITYYLTPEAALIMLAGIYYGAQYGGSTTAILVNLPGEASSVVTCLDGYQMARQGKAGKALAIAALGSFFAGCVATVIIVFLAPPLTDLAQQFGPAEYFSLMTLGLITAVVLAHGSVIKAIAMIFLGLLFGLVGTDVNTGNTRYTFGVDMLFDGIGFVPLAMGVFGIAEIIANLANVERRNLVSSKVSGLMPNRQDLREAAPAVLRGTLLGSMLGILPGGGATLSSFAAYTLEKKISKTPERFGRGAIQGVAAPESANNAASQTSFIPMLTLGIPSNAVMAMMIGGMMIHGIIPGPLVMDERPGLFWGMIASMLIGNAMLLVFNLPLVGLWVRMLLVPYRLLALAILFFCCIGVYSLNNSIAEVLVMAFFGAIGYAFRKLGCEPAPLLLGFILGPMMEVNLRRAMLIAKGDWMVFLTRPISLGLLIVSAILLLVMILPAVNRARNTAFQEQEE
jgi:putative tricarboxylic transport membrane protein